MSSKNRKILLFVDKHTDYPQDKSDQNNVKVVVHQNCIIILQPYNIGINMSYKHYYKK